MQSSPQNSGGAENPLARMRIARPSHRAEAEP
jgi:hypothetical protein